MPRIDIPDGPGEERQRMWQLHPEFGAAAEQFNRVVQERSILGVREHEAARMRMARINQCEPCSEARMADMDTWSLDEAFYQAVDDPDRRSSFTEREQLAIEFAERYSIGRDAFDDPFWTRLRAAYSDPEIVDLTVSVAKWLALGRMNAVLELTVSCPIRIPAPPPA